RRRRPIVPVSGARPTRDPLQRTLGDGCLGAGAAEPVLHKRRRGRALLPQAAPRAPPSRALEASRARDHERHRGASGGQDRDRMGPLAAPPMSTRWFRSLRTEGTVLLLVFVAALELAYAYAALSALRETTARVAAERLEEARALAQRFDGLLALGRERLGALAEQPGLALWLASNGADALARGAAIPQRETLHYLFFRSEIFTGPVAMVDRRSALLWTEPYDAERVAARLPLEHEAVRRALAEARPQISREPLPWRPGPSAVLVHPIVDLLGKPFGALLGEIPLGASKLAGFLDDPRFGSAAVAALLDGEDEPLLASPRAERLLGRAPRSALPSAGTTAMVAAGATQWLVAPAPPPARPSVGVCR